MSTAAVKRYWQRVADLGCLISGGPAEVAHVIGKPSVTERLQEPKPKGKKLPRHDWLVIPLAPEYHRILPYSLDLNPGEFERRYGPVAAMVDHVAAKLNTPVWELAQKGRK